uniref:Uncharacterized protein n=1 Tax=Fundulus heteroclitus TaxID=8078 RepID=A0A3Q2PLK9_FUNHE
PRTLICPDLRLLYRNIYQTHNIFPHGQKPTFRQKCSGLKRLKSRRRSLNLVTQTSSTPWSRRSRLVVGKRLAEIYTWINACPELPAFPLSLDWWIDLKLFL